MVKAHAQNSILSKGVEALWQSDRDIEELIVPRLDEVLSLLTGYIAEIELFNPAYGLVGTRDSGELIVKHILDSLAPLGIIKRLLEDTVRQRGKAGTDSVADIGSGAGLPGIPLAISLPQINFTLIERMGRRAGFLRNTQAALGLSNVAIEEMDMERVRPGRFSVVTFRAFRPLEPEILKKLFRLCAGGGILAAYKGRREKIEDEMAEMQKITGAWEIIPCPVPLLDEERHLLLIQPAADTLELTSSLLRS
jgi:16S rRNA (guanine527-N7)-methyltransferase